MAQKLPVNNNPRQQFATRLGTHGVVVKIWYQPLDSGWYMGIELDDGTPIASSRKLIPFGRPLRGLIHPLGGEFFIVGGQGPMGNQPWTPVGSFSLLFLTPEEIANYVNTVS